MLFKSITYSRWFWTSPPKTWELILLTDDNTNICCLFPENVVYIKSACFLNINFMNYYSLSLDISFTILSPLGSQRFNTFTHHHDQWVISHYSNNSFSSRRVIRKLSPEGVDILRAKTVRTVWHLSIMVHWDRVPWSSWWAEALWEEGVFLKSLSLWFELMVFFKLNSANSAKRTLHFHILFWAIHALKDNC